MSRIENLIKFYKISDFETLKSALMRDLNLIDKKISEQIDKKPPKNKWFLKYISEKINGYDVFAINKTKNWCIVHNGTIQSIKTDIVVINKKDKCSKKITVECPDGYIFIVGNFVVCLSYTCNIIDMITLKKVLTISTQCSVYYDDIYINENDECVLFDMSRINDNDNDNMNGYHLINLREMSHEKISNDDVSDYFENGYVVLCGYLKNKEIYNALSDTYEDFIYKYCS